jgi:DNA polymerase III epsilon subunit-like protein
MSAPIRNRAYVDVETTGFSRSAGAKIIEVGVVVADPDWNIITSYASYVGGVHTDTQDAQKALSVNKINPDHLTHAPSADIIAPIVQRLLDGVMIHAFNVQFEAKFLAASPWNIPMGRWGDCMMIESRRIMGLPKWPCLDKVCAHFGINAPKRHRALEDAKLAMEVHKNIVIRRSI